MATVCCFLCDDSLSEGTNKVKRKRVLGSSMAITLRILDELSVENYQRKVSTSIKPDCFICHKCKKRTEDLPELLRRAQEEKEKLLQQIKKVIIPNKRAHPEDNETESDEHRSKRIQEAISTPCSSTPTASTNDDDAKVSVTIDYPSGSKCIQINTPWRRKNIKRLARRQYKRLSSSVAASQRTSSEVICQVARSIRHEIKRICSLTHDSILRDTYEGIKFFSWQSIWVELKNNLPTLISLLISLICSSDFSSDKPLICMIACMILKRKVQSMSLVQRALSVFLYGNGCTKQVFNCLQPLMISLSHSGTIKVIDRISEDFDIKVHFWSHELLNNLKKRKSQSECATSQSLCSYIEHVPEEEENVEGDYEELISANDYDGDDDDDDDGDAGGKIDDETLELSNLNEDSLLICANVNKDDCSEDEYETNSEWNGFKIVGDNIDKNFRRTYQRIDRQTRSCHYFHSYAVLDRVDSSKCSDLPALGIIEVPHLLPSKEDESELLEVFKTLISRVLVKHLPQFENQRNAVVWHIPHEYSAEMSKRSTIVPLGIDLKNENKLDEMCSILERLHQYVPTETSVKTNILPNGNKIDMVKTDMWEVMFGVDQLTTARARGASAIRANHDTSLQQLKGLFPVIEDWHTRMTLMKVIWKRLFTQKSSCDKGTLFQLKTLIHRTSVPLNPEDNMQAAEDFLELTLEAHIIAAAKALIEDDIILESLSEKMVWTFVKVSKQKENHTDLVRTYACELITLGLLWQAYYDAIKEGDGKRILKLWKYLLLVFKKSGNRNYAKEIAITLLQFLFLTSEIMASQMMNSRFVNTKGRIGCNIPCDLHMEHLNRRLKSLISHLAQMFNLKL